MPAFRRRHLCFAAAALALTLTVPATAAHADAPDTTAALREVLFVGNNWEGTADVIRSTGDFAKIGRIDVVPDKDERMAEINADPIRWIAFMTIRNSVGEGHDQFVDDMYSTPDGKSVVVSRPSFADVVSIDLASGRLNWRFPVSGFRADHMAVSPDGKRVAVSASTGNTVHVLDIDTGRQLGKAATGDKPHENIFTKDGKYIYTCRSARWTRRPTPPWLDWTKGDRRITVIDATTYQQVKVIDMRQRLTRSVLKDYSDAVRPGRVLAGRVQAVLPGVVLQRLLRVRPGHRQDHSYEDPAEESGDQRRPHHVRQRLPPPRPLDEPGRQEAVRRGHHGRLRHGRRPRHPPGGPARHRLQALLGHGQR
ncbi:serine/threonine protein kinase [Streptomyces viridochromogenes DSM 40736]|uniref:Serine/threonine protein kinase n=1 Tax=Streptomyces viridochromogenes (strain DSM 40736 / JCM 4977 / BCRC 1201 / Tue 494) TaxID=591159 RepID=D9XDE2_STRVT|nr:serine/threonine protein kinase [Streptomyces viridochromogenes DSM 40736]